MRIRPAAWAAGALGSLALARVLVRSRRTPTVVEPPAPAPDPRAEELRRKLSESRAIADERDEFEGGETRIDEAQPLADPDVRRRGVHDRGREAVERMRGGSD